MHRVRSKHLCKAIWPKVVLYYLEGRSEHPNTISVGLSQPELRRVAERIRRQEDACAEILCHGSRFQVFATGDHLYVQWDRVEFAHYSTNPP